MSLAATIHFFSSNEEFLRWKEDLESSTTTEFVLSTKGKELAGGKEHTDSGDWCASLQKIPGFRTKFSFFTSWSFRWKMSLPHFEGELRPSIPRLMTALSWQEHELINKLMWSTGPHDQFLSSATLQSIFFHYLDKTYNFYCQTGRTAYYYKCARDGEKKSHSKQCQQSVNNALLPRGSVAAHVRPTLLQRLNLAKSRQDILPCTLAMAQRRLLSWSIRGYQNQPKMRSQRSCSLEFPPTGFCQVWVLASCNAWWDSVHEYFCKGAQQRSCN